MFAACAWLSVSACKHTNNKGAATCCNALQESLYNHRRFQHARQLAVLLGTRIVSRRWRNGQPPLNRRVRRRRDASHTWIPARGASLRDFASHGGRNVCTRHLLTALAHAPSASHMRRRHTGSKLDQSLIRTVPRHGKHGHFPRACSVFAEERTDGLAGEAQCSPVRMSLCPGQQTKEVCPGTSNLSEP